MSGSVPLVEIWRGDILESAHRGHVVVCDDSGRIVESWGNPDQIILPRSSCKMIQALPLLESGAADAAGLAEDRLALACASHSGAGIHTRRVRNWLAEMGFREDDLRCGPATPKDLDADHELIINGVAPCQYHNCCSGKHSGFLTLARHLGGGPEYVNPDHPVQKAVREAFESTTGMISPGHVIDGCSAPNFATSIHGLARAMAYFASADANSDQVRQRAAARLVRAMTRYPELVAGEDQPSTELMREMGGRVAVKSGAEGVFVAILREQRLGVAVKIEDGTPRGAECTIVSILTRLGVLDPDSAAARSRRFAPILNRRGLEVGVIKPVEGTF